MNDPTKNQELIEKVAAKLAENSPIFAGPEYLTFSDLSYNERAPYIEQAKNAIEIIQKQMPDVELCLGDHPRDGNIGVTMTGMGGIIWGGPIEINAFDMAAAIDLDSGEIPIRLLPSAFSFNGQFRPDIARHNPDPEHIRNLISATGLSQNEVAAKCGISGRMIRYYVATGSENRPCPYPIQYLIEQLRP